MRHCVKERTKKKHEKDFFFKKSFLRKKKRKGKMKNPANCALTFKEWITKSPNAAGLYENTFLGNVKESYANLTTDQSTQIYQLSKVSSPQECLNQCNLNGWCGGVSVAMTPIPNDPTNNYYCYQFFDPGESTYDRYEIYPKTGFSSALKPGQRTACQRACDPNQANIPSWCSEAIAPACSINANHPFCRNFCALTQINCDPVFKTYCDNIGIIKLKKKIFVLVFYLDLFIKIIMKVYLKNVLLVLFL